MTYYKLLPYMVSLNTLSIGSRAVFWPPLLMRTHRRDDLRKSHLAFPDRESETEPSAPFLPSSLAAFRHKFAYFCRFRTRREGGRPLRSHFPPRERFTLRDRRLIQFCLVRRRR